jgi:hypothetical protein
VTFKRALPLLLFLAAVPFQLKRFRNDRAFVVFERCEGKFLGAFARLRKATISVITILPTGRILIKFDI